MLMITEQTQPINQIGFETDTVSAVKRKPFTTFLLCSSKKQNQKINRKTIHIRGSRQKF